MLVLLMTEGEAPQTSATVFMSIHLLKEDAALCLPRKQMAFLSIARHSEGSPGEGIIYI